MNVNRLSTRNALFQKRVFINFFYRSLRWGKKHLFMLGFCIFQIFSNLIVHVVGKFFSRYESILVQHYIVRNRASLHIQTAILQVSSHLLLP